MMVRQFVLLIALVLTAGISRQALQIERTELSKKNLLHEDPLQMREVLYLPNGSALQLLSFGYRNTLANILWFHAINYFGKHYRSDRHYPWFAHMCSLITQLNPRAEHVYNFCSTMLAWELSDPDAADRLLEHAISHNPQYWRYYYLRGFNAFYFLQNSGKAEQYLALAAKQEGAPAFVGRLAASKIVDSDPAAAALFLRELLQTVKDPYQRNLLEDKLRQVQKQVDELASHPTN